jgi:subtilisin-like proprotein convertase family protein
MNKISLLLLFIVSSSAIYAQSISPWKKISQEETVIFDKNSAKLSSGKQLLFQLDETALKKSLTNIKDKRVEKTGVEISIPNANGVLERFLVWESSNFEPELQAKYPEIRAYAGTGITDHKASLHFSFSSNGIQTMILRADSGSEFIERYSKNQSIYVLFDSKNRDKGALPFNCTTEDIAINKQLLNKTSGVKANNQVFKTLRLALSCTGEYTAFHGGTIAGALAAMNATMTRVNGIFNKDLAVKLNIIANDNLIIYTNAATDPYSDATAGADGAWNQELQTNLTTTIGESNYDIGHLFGASGGGGNSGCIGCVCVSPTTAEPSGKGSAFTSPSDGIPQGDTFDIDFVAHEMGHQLGANHTFSYALEGTGVNVEPGSGSTIMGYAGITDYDVQASSDDYFAYASILQIQNNLSTKSCPLSTTITNRPPVISAGPDWTIPKGTAFKLTGTGSDINGDTITYCWEEDDSATTQDGALSIAFPTKTDGPLFRSKYPSGSAIRYMPAFSDVISNRLSNMWESVSNIARTLHFTLTGRDNAALGTAQTNTDAMVVNVSGTVGPFAITSQNTADVGWPTGSNQTISWSVNGSNGLAGSANVNIKLSTDGGVTFPTDLATSTPNDGSQTIIAPNVTASNCRILIEPTANIYYAVNSTPFAIGYSVVTACNTYTFPETPFAIPEQAAYTTKTISSPASTTVMSDVNLSLGLTHTYLSDVQIDVVSPQGTTVKLFERSCGASNSSLLLNYDDLGGVLSCGTTTAQTVAPFESLSAFNGQNPQGIWTLRVRDDFKDDTGTLDSASITICTKTYTISAPIVETRDLTVYSNPNNGNFNIQFSSNFASDIQVLVHDLLGRKVYEENFKKSELFNENIQLENVQPGVYFVTVMNGIRVGVKKIIVN